MSANKFKVGDVVKCVDDSSHVNLTAGKEYVVVETYGDDIMIDNGDEDDFYYHSYRFELSNGGSANAQQTYKSPKFKVGDVVKCVDSSVSK